MNPKLDQCTAELTIGTPTFSVVAALSFLILLACWSLIRQAGDSCATGVSRIARLPIIQHSNTLAMPAAKAGGLFAQNLDHERAALSPVQLDFSITVGIIG